MFRPVSMLRLRVILLKEDERAVLMNLGQLGILHLTRTRAGADTAPVQPFDGKAELEQCDDLLQRCEKLSPGGPCDSAPTELTLATIDSALRRLETEYADLLATRQTLLSRKQELDALCSRIASYRDLDIPLDASSRFSFLHFITGSIPEERMDQLAETLGRNAVILPLALHGGRRPILVMTTPANRTQTEARLHELEFQNADLPGGKDQTASALFEETHRERQRVERELLQMTGKIKAFAADVARSAALFRDRVKLERLLVQARQHFPRTDATLLLSGWLPASQAMGLEDGIRAVTRDRCVIELSEPDKEDGAEVPVLLEHRGWLRPFQRMVAAYGLPVYADLEPTLLVAISYVIMFGMMFGDAGQGVLLALSGWIALRFSHSDTWRDLGRVLIPAGLASVGFGLVYGSYFGIPRFKSLALWRDPLEGNPLDLMLAAVGMGVAVISVGLVLNIINRFRRGELAEGWLGRFGIMGVLFYWGALALTAKAAVFQTHGQYRAILILLLAIPLLGWMLKEPIRATACYRTGSARESGGIPVILAESFIGALEGVTAYLANTTSFVRLAAYAMSHSALLMAVFTVAEAIRQDIPLGGAWSVLVIILGNVVAIILEGVIAAVQALRLEYYEFFGKFLSGNGLPYSPFRLPAAATVVPVLGTNDSVAYGVRHENHLFTGLPFTSGVVAGLPHRTVPDHARSGKTDGHAAFMGGQGGDGGTTA